MKKTKSKPKLKKPARRVRRSPYGRALELANKRFDKAVAEYAKCQIRIAALEQEIPRLNEMQRVLEGYIRGNKPGSVPPAELGHSEIPALRMLPVPTPSAPVNLPASIADRIPEHLRRFIPVHPSMLRESHAQGGVVATKLTSGDADDRFLPEPTGTVILE